MTVLPRAATATELDYIRRDNQSSRLYLTVHQPSTVYTARLAAVPSSTDQVVSITYNSGSGTHTNVLIDQTCLVGSTAGGFDYGQFRVRGALSHATAGSVAVGECSEVNWQANAYLTFIDEFVPWAKHLRTVGTTVYQDYDVAYTDQHSLCDSVPVLGSHAVAWLRGASVTVSFDASQSWALNNTINGYAWTFAGAASSTGTTTATPAATYTTAGVYRVQCAISNDDSKTFTGYRYVFVVNDSTVIDQFSVNSVRGDYSSGGWSFDVEMYDQADRVTIRDRALCILHAVDYYGSTRASAGMVADRENIVAIGWIANDQINWQPQDKSGSVSFRVEGLQYWLNKMPAFPVGLKDQNSSPSKWTKFQGLTAKAATWHMLHWRTTMTRFTDVFPCDDAHRAARIEAPGAQSLWQQLNTMLDQSVIAKSTCDRYGRLFNQIEQQVLNSTEKTSIPSVMTLTGADWSGQIDIERRATPECSMADFSGVAFDGATATPYFSLSPGHVFKQFGAPEIRERLILDTQTIANQRCGAFCGWRNSLYPRITVDLAANNRLIDIAPYQWVTMNISTADTVREITASSLKIIPRSVEYIFQNGYITSRVDFEAESTAEISVTNIRPPVIITPIEIITPPPPPPPPVPTPTATGTEVWLWHYNSGATPANAVIYSTDFFSALGSPTWHLVAALPADLASIEYGSIRGDGTTCYIVGLNTGSPQRRECWKCSNPKDGSPTWTKALGYGAAVPGGGGVTLTTGNIKAYDEAVNGYAAITEIVTSPPTPANGDVFAAETDESGLLTAIGIPKRNPDGSYTYPVGLWNSYTEINSTRKLKRLNDGYHARGLTTYPGGYGAAAIADTWNTWGTWTNLAPPFYNTIYGVIDGDLAIAGSIGVPPASGIVPVLSWRKILVVGGREVRALYGSFYGNTVYALLFDSVTGLNYLYYSTNGVDFALSSSQGWLSESKVFSANLSGGKFAIWVACRLRYGGVSWPVTNSNEFIRYCVDISNVTANPWTSATGDLWTNIITAGNATFMNAGIVYA